MSALEAVAHISPHTRDCKAPVSPPATEPRPHDPVPCTAHSSRIPTEADPHASTLRSRTSPSA